MDDVTVEDLLDDIITDAMTPAWVCFSYQHLGGAAEDARAGVDAGVAGQHPDPLGTELVV